GFGSLAHEVLGLFGRDPVAGSADADEIAGCLAALLDRVVIEKFGKTPLSAILVQVEQLRLRLRALSAWQAQWRAQGWRIEHAEVSVSGEQAALVVDGKPMFLRGRIDRIDIHEETLQRIIFDYKTSDRARTPGQTHRKGEAWIDLQLPLYRHLAPALGIAGDVGLAYIALPKDLAKVGPLPAPWTAEELVDADRTAEEVIRKVRTEKFWPPVSPPPAFSEQFAAICEDDRFGAVLLPDEN
ncbi:MAG: PD-(D/E)XK nuclease family protein, partial [Thermoguttaceae bacterium]